MAATIITQSYYSIKAGLNANLMVTLCSMNAATDTISLPRMSGTSGKVAQLLRPGDSAVTVTQGSATDVTLSNGVLGRLVLLVSFHDDPIPSPKGDGA